MADSVKEHLLPVAGSPSFIYLFLGSNIEDVEIILEDFIQFFHCA